jgi:CxxC-x17-CxxC domain-containing protein
MDVQFVDRILICSDCHGEFIFTAGEQLFFHDKQFKNDPKRCKPCKSRRSGLSAAANGTGPAAAGLSRTETRTECSECGVQTTVPFKPTQGRPVLCRQCFQIKNKAAAAASASASAEITQPSIVDLPSDATAVALTAASAESNGQILSADAAVLAAASMASSPLHSSVASAADLASISDGEALPPATASLPVAPSASLLAVQAQAAASDRINGAMATLSALSAEASEA